MAIPIILTVTFFATVFGIVYMALTIRNRERMALIEKGADASLFYPERAKAAPGRTFWTLKAGMLAMGIGIGFVIGNLLDTYTTMQEEGAYFSMIFLFGGLGLVLNYLIERKLNN